MAIRQGLASFPKGLGKGLVFLLFAALGTFGAQRGGAEDLTPAKARLFQAYFENDLFAGTDQYYTNAVKLTLVSRDLKTYLDDKRLPVSLRRLLTRVPLVNRQGEMRNIGLSLGQDIYTPRDITVSALQEDERPYAGWTYGSLALHSKTNTTMDTLELSLGIVGPSSRAEQSQKVVHRWVGSPQPQGWDHQLKDEPGLMLTWLRNWRLSFAETNKGLASDFIPHMGATAGNVMTYANLGGEVRWGWNLPPDFGAAQIRPGAGISAPVKGSPGKGFGFYLFAGVDGRAVARNIFLDGNTFRDSHSVDRRIFVADLMAGMSLRWGEVSLTYAHVLRTEEFDGQDSPQKFGSLSLGILF